MNADHLSEIFGKFGAVVSVNLVRERVSKVPKGFAFVVFKTHSDAEKAQDHMHDGWLDGKKVRVRFASDDDQRRSRSVERSNNNGSSSNNNNSANGRRGAWCVVVALKALTWSAILTAELWCRTRECAAEQAVALSTGSTWLACIATTQQQSPKVRANATPYERRNVLGN